MKPSYKLLVVIAIGIELATSPSNAFADSVSLPADTAAVVIAMADHRA